MGPPLSDRNQADVVIGALFGDEGKGKLTDTLSADGADLVVRINGGAQAGHTVVTPKRRRHVFSHFGSGTLAGAATHLSRYFVASPMHYRPERRALLGLGAIPIVSIDPTCPVTTPFDVMINQAVERSRGASRHGSCGIGFGETLERHSHPRFALTVADLVAGDLERRLSLIRRHYVPLRLHQLGIEQTVTSAMIDDDGILDTYLKDVTHFLETVCVRPLRAMAAGRKLVFEGAQGLLLDQERGYFPHVTRSHTGIRNATRLATELGIDRLTVHYATRVYATRHGAGPLPRELAGKPFAGINDPTNQPNEHQGSLRFAWLDVDLLAASIQADLADCPSDIAIDHRLVVGCTDQVGPLITSFQDGRKSQDNAEDLARTAAKAIGRVEVRLGHGPARGDFHHLTTKRSKARAQRAM